MTVSGRTVHGLTDSLHELILPLEVVSDAICSNLNVQYMNGQ